MRVYAWVGSGSGVGGGCGGCGGRGAYFSFVVRIDVENLESLGVVSRRAGRLGVHEQSGVLGAISGFNHIDCAAGHRERQDRDSLTP